MKPNKKIGFIFLIFAIIFAPVSFSNIFVQSQTSGDDSVDGYQEWTRDRSISGLITVNAGATLVIKNGITLTFDGGNMDIKGTLVVSGTVKNPVKFKKSENSVQVYTINIMDEGSLIMRNADISGAGYEATYVKNNSLLNTANAFFAGGINMSGGSLDIQGSSFHNNIAAISIQGGQARVNRTKFFDNQYDVPQGSGDFRYNWWGSSDGPSETCFEYFEETHCYHDKIDDQIDHSSYLEQEDFRDPVIIIPGIMGSWEKNGIMQIDPIFHTYDNLYGEFANNGYTPEENLFTFPYEWRDSNIDNAQKLKIKIGEIKQQNNWPKVDIVAHSMGGLLAREYIESGDYGNDVDQLITIGTPQKGAPKDYLTWEGGEIGIKITDILDNLAEKVFALEAHEKGYSGIFDYIRNRPILSVQELLPVYSYLYDDGNQRVYPTDYPVNLFLETLNNSNGISKLHNVEFDNIVGNLDGSDSTISRIDVIESDDDLLWEHGYPEDFDALFGDHGLEYGDGDGTVPLESASLPTVDEKIEINAKHGALPEEAAEETFKLLTKHSPQNISLSKRIKNIISIFVYSPIDIQVIAPNGKWVGRNIKNLPETDMIEGAYYTGYDGVDSEFLTIPDPKGNYTIITQGTDNDTYRIEVTKLTEDPSDGEVTESSATISGTAIDGQPGEEKTITVEDNKITTEAGAEDKTPPEIAITSPENKNYSNNQIIPITYAISDNASEAKNIKIAMFIDAVAVSTLQINLALQKLGKHIFKITAIDEAGNQSEKEVKFTVVTSAGAISQNIAHYRKIGLITDKKTFNTLRIRIKLISGTLDLIAKMDKKNKLKVEKVLIGLLNKEIDDMIALIQRKFANTIKPPAGELLIESLSSLKK